ncbi:hypothetical protein ACWDUL_21145 [Nocardia niigatensis]
MTSSNDATLRAVWASIADRLAPIMTELENLTTTARHAEAAGKTTTAPELTEQGHYVSDALNHARITAIDAAAHIGLHRLDDPDAAAGATGN